MKVDGIHRRTIWLEDDGAVGIIDQNRLPFEFTDMRLETYADAARVISDMHVRGAGLIGATAGYGMYLAVKQFDGSARAEFDTRLARAADELTATRPTARNLAWAVETMLSTIDGVEASRRVDVAREAATRIADEDARACREIGAHGLPLIRKIGSRTSGDPIRILTHCNAGWLAFVDYGSATSPIYAAHDSGLQVHVWVDETRPRNQGARLTAWELAMHGVPHALIADNTGGHLMQHGMVDLVIVGADRVTRSGDAANKIGTYLKALAAADNGVPFYVALPSSTFDWELSDGLREIPIEERNQDEIRYVSGIDAEGVERSVRICPDATPASNFGFDVTPARLITGLITERGVCDANEDSIQALYPELIPEAK